MNFLSARQPPPLQHAALLISVLMSAGFPRAEEWDVVGEMWQRDPPSPSLSSPVSFAFFFRGSGSIQSIQRQWHFVPSFCPSCRPAFLYCWATIVRTKWRGVAPISRLLSGTCQGDLGVSHTSHFADLFEWRHMAAPLNLAHNYALTTALLELKAHYATVNHTLCARLLLELMVHTTQPSEACARFASCRNQKCHKK